MAKQRTTAQPQAIELTTGSPDETQAVGEQLGRRLQPGDVAALFGELGSGKTTLIQGIARGLGLGPEAIKSPTFVLVREYPLPNGGTLVHIDGYRLAGAPAAAWLDLDLLLSPRTITLIEWAERFAGLLPQDHLELRLDHVSTNRRRLTLLPRGARAEAVAADLRPAPDAGAAAPAEADDAAPRA